MANELDAQQGKPEGEAALNPGNNAAPEQNDDQLNTDAGENNAGEEIEGSAEGQEGNDAGEGAGEETQEVAKPKPGEKKKLPWELRRINEETNKRREAERRAADLEARLAKLENGESGEARASSPEDDIDTRVARHAEHLLEQRNFKTRVDSWASAGVTEFGADEFNAQCNLIASLVDDKSQRELMDTLTDPDQVKDGHKVIMELASDPEEAERILSLPPKKMALALSKISDRIGKPATPAPKPISKVPAPVTTVGGSPKATTRLEDPDIPMDKFADEFLTNMAKRGR